MPNSNWILFKNIHLIREIINYFIQIEEISLLNTATRKTASAETGQFLLIFVECGRRREIKICCMMF